MARVLRFSEPGKCLGCYNCMLACAREVMGSYSVSQAAIRIRNEGGLQTEMVADLCRACREPTCAASCEEQALQARAEGGVRLVSGRCTGCARCVEACPVQYLEINPATGKPTVCRHCGICSSFCPHGVFIMEEVGDYAESGIHPGPGY